MQVKLLINGDMGNYCNCYGMLSDSAAIVVDPARCTDAVVKFLSENSDKKRLILITHAHFDHIGGARELRRRTGVKIAVGVNEAFALGDARYNLSALFGSQLEPFVADYTIEDDEEFTVGDITIKAIETPGHTVGGMCYLAENCLFSGDTLFRETAGRTDFLGGSMQELRLSLDRLMWMLDDDVTVYSGHGPQTTIGHERKFNPYLR